ncbi:hypothetical protein FRC07_001672, partial [Ceratobasidium sp. 392]
MSFSVQLEACVQKLQSSDQGTRLVALQQFSKDLTKSALVNRDANLEVQIVRHVVALLSDQNDKIQNQACQCVGQLVKVIRPSQIDYVVARLIEMLGHTNGELHVIADSALKMVATELPKDTAVAPRVIRKIVPALLQQLSKPTTPANVLIGVFEILKISLSRFQTYFPS